MSRRARRRKASRKAVTRKLRSQSVAAHGAASPAPARRGRAEQALRVTLFAVLGLLLLTPFVVDTGTVFPFIVAKALWSRSLIGIAFALWAVLALAYPGYRPPRAWLLVLLAAGLGVSLASAWFGVGFGRSLWSTYERMHGVLDQAHWFALAVVLAGAVRGGSAWRALLGAHAVAGAAVACIVIARAADIEVPYYGGLPELSDTRMGGPLGNPLFLSVYMLANLLLAAAFSARAWLAGMPGRRPGAYGWAAIAGLHFAGLALAGSVGGFAGLIGAVGFAALARLWLPGRRGRMAAATVLGVLALGAAALTVRFVDPALTTTASRDRAQVEWPGASALRYVSRAHLQRPSVQARFAAWEAGLDGFAERPLLGWGPGNFTTVFGLFGTGYAASSDPHDQAHSKLIELASTTGLAGLSAWFALWALALVVLLRAARAAEPPDRAFAVLVAAGVAGHLVQAQFLFDTATGTLFATVAIAFAARLESGALPPAWRLRWPPAAARLRSRIAPQRSGDGFPPRPARRALRISLGAAAVALAIWGLSLNRTIYIAADNRHVAPDAIPQRVLAEGIEAFPPLAEFYRRLLFLELERNWPSLRPADPELAAELLAWADREADAAILSQPWNWRFQRRLARLYRVVADTDTQYEDRAQRHLARSNELAPVRAVFPAPLERPSDLSSRALPGEPAAPAGQPASGPGLELRWNPAPNAGFHQIARSTEPGAWSPVLFTYDPEQHSFVVPACADCRYRIRACRTFSQCGRWTRWP